MKDLGEEKMALDGILRLNLVILKFPMDCNTLSMLCNYFLLCVDIILFLLVYGTGR